MAGNIIFLFSFREPCKLIEWIKSKRFVRMTHCSGKFILFTVELIKWLYLEKKHPIINRHFLLQDNDTETRAPLFYQPAFLRKSEEKVRNERVHLLLVWLKKKKKILTAFYNETSSRRLRARDLAVESQSKWVFLRIEESL